MNSTYIITRTFTGINRLLPKSIPTIFLNISSQKEVEMLCIIKIMHQRFFSSILIPEYLILYNRYNYYHNN